MQTRKVTGSSTAVALVMALTLSPSAIGAGIEVGVGGGNCSDVQRQITRDWFQLKGFFRPDNQNLKRPKSRDFYCVAPSYVHDAFQQPSRTASLKCYSLQSQKFCCDSGLSACAGL